MKNDTALITFVLLTVIFVSVATVIISCFAIVAERDNKAIQAGLQQCVVGTRSLWQKECGK